MSCLCNFRWTPITTPLRLDTLGHVTRVVVLAVLLFELWLLFAVVVIVVLLLVFVVVLAAAAVVVTVLIVVGVAAVDVIVILVGALVLIVVALVLIVVALVLIVGALVLIVGALVLIVVVPFLVWLLIYLCYCCVLTTRYLIPHVYVPPISHKIPTKEACTEVFSTDPLPIKSTPVSSHREIRPGPESTPNLGPVESRATPTNF